MKKTETDRQLIEMSGKGWERPLSYSEFVEGDDDDNDDFFP